MMSTTRRGTLGIAVAGLALTVGLAGCSSGKSTASTASGSGSSAGSSASSAPMSSSPMSSPSSSASSSAMASPFGAACASVPKSGAGSFQGMTSAPVASAAGANPVLSTLVTAVKKAGLVDTLNGASNITVFAPANSAFSKVPSATLTSLLANKAELTKVLTYHVVSGRLSPSRLAGTHKTLEGSTVTVTGSGDSFTVNGDSMVVCGNVQTANATVYIVDTVLMPPTS